MAADFGTQGHPVSLDPFRTIVNVHWGSDARTWRVDYTYLEGSYDAAQITAGVFREYDKTDPFYAGEPAYNVDWDISWRQYAIDRFQPVAEGAVLSTSRSFVTSKYNRLMGVPYLAADGQYTLKDWTFTASKPAFAGFPVNGHHLFYTRSEEELAALPGEIAEWWAALVTNGDRYNQKNYQKQDHYEVFE